MKSPSAASKPRRKSPRVSPAHAPDSPDARPRGESAEGPSNDVSTRIAMMAYHLYEKRGRHDGHDLEDWLMAEQLVVAPGSTSAAQTNGKP